MAILDNFENALDDDFNIHPLVNLYNEHVSLTNKIFSETVCEGCESKPRINTDNMGRDTSMYS
jgi:hypothetical protein